MQSAPGSRAAASDEGQAGVGLGALAVVCVASLLDVTLQAGQSPQLRLADIERALEEGSRRVYQPRGETEVIEKPRR